MKSSKTSGSSRFMMYFKPTTLNELRVISRMLNVAMVDYVDAALTAYILKRESELGGSIPTRLQKRYVGPRIDTSEDRVRYVMRLDRHGVEKMRDIAYLDSRRFTHVCDDALATFIAFTKDIKNFKNVWLSRDDVEAIRGRKSARSVESISALIDRYAESLRDLPVEAVARVARH
jgi:hypothetical protein